MGDHLMDVISGAQAHGFPVGVGLFGIIIPAEKPVRHIGVPHQHMAPHPDIVFPGPADHHVCGAVVHHRHAVGAGKGSGVVQQGIGLGFVGAGDGIEMGLEVGKIGFVFHGPGGIDSAHFEAVLFGQGVKGREGLRVHRKNLLLFIASVPGAGWARP